MATYTFNGNSDSNWNNPSNWNELDIPSSYDNVIIGTNNSITVSAAGSGIPPTFLYHFNGINDYTDSGPYNITAAPSGNTTIAMLGGNPSDPFGNNGYKVVYFDGTAGTNLVISDHTSLGLNGDFTIELWLYYIDGQYIMGRSESGVGNDWILTINNGTLYFGTSTTVIGTITTVLPNVWHHIAVTRKSSTVKLFLNGVEEASGAITDTGGTTYPLTVGADSSGTNTITGYIDEIRMVNGWCLYDGPFDPPKQEFTNYTVRVNARTSLLLHFDVANDSSPDNHTITFNGNAILSNAQSKFGGSSLYLDGVSDSNLSVSNNLFDFSSSDWTIEFWMYPLVSNAFQPIFLIDQGIHIYLYNDNKIYINDAISGVGGFSGGSFGVNQWYHIAVVRNSGTLTVYVNGVSIGSYGTPFGQTTGPLTIGEGYGSNFTGYIDELRVVKGAALYALDFSPPSSPHTTLNSSNYTNPVANDIIYGSDYTLNMSITNYLECNLTAKNILFRNTIIGGDNNITATANDIKLVGISAVSAGSTLTSPNSVKFNDSSTNAGTITNDAQINYPINPYTNLWNSGTVSGTITTGTYPNFYYYTNDYSYNWFTQNNWWIDSGHTIQAAYIPGTLDNVIIQSSVGSTNQTMYAKNATIEVPFWNFNYGLVVGETVTFTGSSSLGLNYLGTPGVVTANNAILSADASPPVVIGPDGTLTVSANVDMNGSSINNGTINGNVRFYDSSSNTGSIVGNATIYYPHVAPLYSGNGNTGSISGTVTYMNYPSRNLNFMGGPSADWGDLTRWSENGSPVTYVALSSDNVSISEGTQLINSLPNFIPTVNNLTVQSNNSEATFRLNTPLVVNGTASINIATFEVFDSNYIVGTFNFADQGRAIIFNDSSYNNGTINCVGASPTPSTNTIVFNNSSYNNNIIYAPDGFVNLDFNNSSYNSNTGTITGYPTFNNSSINQGSITGNVELKDSSSNSGTITGNTIIHYPHNRNIESSWNTSSITGTKTFSSYPSWFYFLANGGTPTFDWNDINHWYVDPPVSYTTPSTETRAGYIPGPLDSVKAYMSISNNSNIETASVNIFNGEYNAEIGIPLNCNCANFNGSSRYSGSNLTQNNSVNSSGCGIIFNESSSNTGTINGAGCSGEIVGPIVFNDISYNGGIINGCTPGVEFREGSSNTGTVNGILTRVYYPVSIPFGGTVNTPIIYSGYTYYFNDTTNSNNDGNWSTTNNWFLDSANTAAAGGPPSEIYPGENVALQSSVTTSTSGSPTAYNLTCGNQSGCPGDNPNPAFSISGTTIVVNGLATFQTDHFCFNSSTGGILGATGTIDGDALFKDFGTNQGGTINGLATFTLQAAENMIYNAHGGNYNGGIEFQYGKGVNGSNILGIV